VLARTIAEVEQKIAGLLAARQSAPLDSARFSPSQGPALHLLSLLQQYRPLLRDMQARLRTHPRELYDALAALVGALDVHGEGRPAPVPLYNASDCGAVFKELTERLTGLLSRTAIDRALAFPFKRVDESTFRVALRPEAFAGRRPFLVASGADEQILRDRVPSLAKIASSAAMEPLLNSSVRGVSIAVEFDPPPELPTRRAFVCYRLDVRDRHWADIRERLDMVVHLPIKSPTLELTLYALE
jgi:predicted component of type VI protein secretion system